MEIFHKTFSEVVGRSTNKTKVIHAPSYLGHKIDGKYSIEVQNKQSSRLLFAGMSNRQLANLFQKFVEFLLKPLI